MERQLLMVLGGLPLALVVAFGVYLVNFDRSILPQLPYDWPMLAGVTLIITLVLPALAVRSIVRRNLRPLADVGEVIRRVTRGDYSKRVRIRRGSDFQRLSTAFNKMTDQLAGSAETSQSVADIDRLLLASAGIDPVIRKVLISARMDAVETMLILRLEPTSGRLTTYRLKGKRVEEAVGLVEVRDHHVDNLDGFRRLSEQLCDGHLRECLPIAPEGMISGVLVATSLRALNGAESKRLTDLAGRLAVAITSIKRSDTLYNQAHFDGLTGLLNRHAFEDRLQEFMARTARGDRGAVLFIDLDGFKKVNDTEGHKAGDRLLVEIGERLTSTLRDVDTIARLGGDEFAVIAADIKEEKALGHLCERIVAAIIKPVVVNRMEHTVGASIGVALFPDDGQSVEELVMKADSAMYRAKDSGGARYAFFDDTLNKASRYRVLVESRLRKALKRGLLEVHFQPKLRLEDRAVDSAEALMRWTDRELGEVGPSTFVPIAEESKLIHEFTDVLVSKTADLLWQADEAGLVLGHIAINASARQLVIEGFGSTFLGMLDNRNVPHHNVQIEITESVFERDTQAVVKELDTLRNAGVRIALDDFGTGFSSLNMLRELPLDVVKIDRTFITELDSSEQARVLVRHLISIVKALNKQVVAEGVETERQLRHLIDAECDYVQGFLVSKAKPPKEFIRLVSGWRSGGTNPVLRLVT